MTPFGQALHSRKGQIGLLVCLVSILFVVILLLLRRYLFWEIPSFLLLIPGIASTLGMQTFANEANRLRLLQEEQDQNQQRGSH